MRGALARLAMLVLIAAAIAVLLFPGARAAALTALGEVMVVSDAPGTPDVVVVTSESGAAGDLEAGDLYARGGVRFVLVLKPAPLPIDRELQRRGVRFPDFATETLVQLGIPRSTLTMLDAGEGGTTENTRALAAWAREHRPARVAVVVGPTHARRYRRALKRVWPEDVAAPAIVPTPYSAFKASDWWESRTTLREGIVELQKLTLDLLLHPLG